MPVPAFAFPPSITRGLRPPLAAIAISLAIASAPNIAHALGVRNGLLQDCQQNQFTCVASQDDTPSVFLEPWEYDEDIEDVQALLLKLVLSEPQARLVEQTSDYIRFELPSDDLEFFFPRDDNIVHFRSARRGPGFDFLENRRRLERIRGKAGLTQITVLRGRQSTLNMFETPFDKFAPSAVDADAIIEYGGPGSRPAR